MNDNILPEEKLLRLIRGNKNNDLAGNNIDKAPAIALKSASKYFSPCLFQRLLTFLNFRIMLWVLFIAACIYLVISFIYPWVGLRGAKFYRLTPEKISEFNNASVKDVKPYEFYLEGIGDRRIFANPAKQETYKELLKGVSKDLLRDITLLGIVSGENPQAIIEDKLAQKTYYLNKGQFIGELQVTDIGEGKITLDFNGQAFELNL